MNTQIKKCQNCKQQFIIEPDDFSFYQKIKVPSPTFCPDCRIQRRLCFRNERTLYERKCDATGKDIISIYSSDKPFKVYDQKYWWSDKWDSLEYGREYDFNRSFFEQFRGLMIDMPQIALHNVNPVNTSFANFATGSKDCYLIFGAYKNEGVMYTSRPAFSKDSMDVYIVSKNELCYENIYCTNCYHLFFSNYCDDCHNSAFLYDCKNCSDCFGCIGLKNKSHRIFNRQYSKEDYNRKIAELNLGSFKLLLSIKEKFRKLSLKYPRKYARLVRAFNTTGEYVENAKNCHYCFNLVGSDDPVEDCKFLEWGTGSFKDSYDCMGHGVGAELHYEIVDGENGSRTLFGVTNYHNNQASYFINCHSCYNLFGCVGLRKKRYCILNKQYSKEEYEKLAPKIIQHMNDMPYTDKKDRVYKYGEFFPPELSPFAYNETVAQEYFPLTKERAINQGYQWKNPEKRDYEITIKPRDLPDHIKDVKDDILKQVVGCQHKGKCNEQCTTAFKIIPDELQFYKRMNIPLPRLCPNCRHYQRLKQRNPLRLWHRKCQCADQQSDNKVYKNTISHFHKGKHCPNEFETAYSPERPEIVYCKKCYQSEVV